MFLCFLLLVSVLSCFGVDSSLFTALVGKIMGENPTCRLKYIICKHMVSMRRMLLMLFCQKFCQQLPVLFVAVQLTFPIFPFVVT